jgi:hypothetical protein
MAWRRSNKTAEKGCYLPHLLHALEQEGCPLCAAVIADSEHSLNALLCETDIAENVRADAIAAYGFCNWHAWRATYVFSASASIAMLYQSLLEKLEIDFARLVKTLEQSREPRLLSPLRRHSAHRLVSAGKICPVCEWNRSLEKQHLSDLLDFFHNPALALKFERAFGLCLPHLQMAVDEFPQHVNLPPLLEAEQNKFAVLQAELAEFDRQRSDPATKKSPGAEQTSWRRAIELFVGKRGVFPRPDSP